MNSRAIAARLLQQVLVEHHSLTEVLQSKSLQTLPPRDQSLVRDLCFGCMRWHERLSAILKILVTKPLKAADSDIECVLRIGLYQLIYQRTPEHACVNECVNAAREFKKQWAGGLINAVLRRFIREQDAILAQVDLKPAVRYAFPQWLFKRIQKTYPTDWEAILQASNAHPPFVLRVNQQQYTTAQYQTLLAEIGSTAQTIEFAPQALVLDTPVAVTALPDFEQGAVSVQDTAAQLAAQLLDCQTGDYVLDACAAPGGKTCHLLETIAGLELVAIDSSEKRLQQVQHNLQRLKLAAKVVCADAGDLDSWWEGRLFDRILLDAPCSATGVIRRHPDIKYLRQETDIAALQQAQAQLLKQLWSVLKSGGILLYVTCSILADENELQVQQFLASHSDARALAINASWGEARSVGRQILPHQLPTMDGFYYALLQKQ